MKVREEIEMYIFFIVDGDVFFLLHMRERKRKRKKSNRLAWYDNDMNPTPHRINNNIALKIGLD